MLLAAKVARHKHVTSHSWCTKAQLCSKLMVYFQLCPYEVTRSRKNTFVFDDYVRHMSRNMTR